MAFTVLLWLNLNTVHHTKKNCVFCVFQEQLRRRREEEERIAQQNEFLRASLRGSRKLQALQDNHPLASEQQRPPAGIDNDAFIADEDVERILGKWREMYTQKKTHTIPYSPNDQELIQKLKLISIFFFSSLYCFYWFPPLSMGEC